MEVQEQKNKALFDAVTQSNESLTLVLLQDGADVNSTINVSRERPLHVAVDQNDLSLCELLTNCGAQVNAGDLYGFTPFHYAVEFQNFELVKMLFEKGANVLKKNRLLKIPLHYACQGNLIEIVEFLLEKQAKDQVNSKDLELNSPLHIAVRNENLKAVKILMKHGANVNSVNGFGVTPLNISCHKPSVIFEILLAKGANINTEELQNALPLELDLFRQSNFVELTLMSHVAKLNSMNARVGQRFIDYINGADPYSKQFIECCEIRLNKLKREKISKDYSLTLHDLLTKPEDEIFRCLRNVEIRKNVQKMNFEEKFEMYVACATLRVLEGSLLKAEEFDKCYESICSILPTELPLLCTSRIMRYFNDEEIEKILRDQ